MINVVFMGTPEYAKEILDALIKANDINIKAIFTQPDKRVGRKKILTPPPVKVLAKEHNIEVFQPTTLRDKNIIKKLKNLKPDFIVVAAYGQLLPKDVLEIAPSINLHASILPLYRGASPIQQALLNGDEYSGVTAMLMDEGLDTGDILGFSFIKTTEAPTLPLMMSKLSKMASSLTLSTLREFDNLNPIAQLNAISSKCKKIKKADGLVDFSDANSLYRKYSAYYGWPGVYLESGLKLHDIELINCNKNYKSGQILDIIGDSIIVGCQKGALKINSLQPPSKAKMSAKSYILGKRIDIGDTLFW